MSHLTHEQLIEIGVNPDNLNYPCGEMNIIVQLFGMTKEDILQDQQERGDNSIILNPDIYQPRKNSVWSCNCSGDGFDISSQRDKEDFIKHLRDSAERLKIMAYLLSQQANEIETIGYPVTTCYYPE